MLFFVVNEISKNSLHEPLVVLELYLLAIWQEGKGMDHQVHVSLAVRTMVYSLET